MHRRAFAQSDVAHLAQQVGRQHIHCAQLECERLDERPRPAHRQRTEEPQRVGELLGALEVGAPLHVSEQPFGELALERPVQLEESPRRLHHLWGGEARGGGARGRVGRDMGWTGGSWSVKDG